MIRVKILLLDDTPKVIHELLRQSLAHLILTHPAVPFGQLLYLIETKSSVVGGEHVGRPPVAREYHGGQ